MTDSFSIVSFFRSRWVRIILLLLSALLIAVEGTWTLHLYHTWFFVSLMSILGLCLIVTVVDDFRLFRSWASRFSHTGMLLVMLGMMLGAVWMEDGKAIVRSSASTRIAYTQDAQPMALPFDLQLRDFHIDFYEDGQSPKQFTSSIWVQYITSGDSLLLTTSVNYPDYYRGYYLYQDSFDRDATAFSVIRVVRDPLLPVTYMGFLLLAIGSVLAMANRWQWRRFWPVALVLTLVFGVISVAKVNFGTLMPALRSLWFVPHLIIYMLAYSLLALALIASVISLFPSMQVRWSWLPHTCSSLLQSASSLLLLGMLCGAVWAKQAWGDYWTWDAKECWAATTWLFTIAATHLSHTTHLKKMWQIIFIALSFLAMQITWYGVNYLPSAQHSLHTYNTNQSTK